MNNLLTRIVSALTLLVFPCATTMAEPNALVYANGNVTINGSTVSGSSVVVAGDNVQTDKNAMAMISRGESMVRLSADSSVAYQGNSVELKYGASVIASKSGMAGQLAGLSVSPASPGGTKFGLVSQKGKQVIAALEGPLQITDGVHTVTLAPGQSLTRNLATAETEQSATSQTGNSNGQEGSTGSTQPQSPKDKRRGGAASSKGIPGWGIELMIEGAAGGILGGMAATGAFDHAKSPSKP